MFLISFSFSLANPPLLLNIPFCFSPLPLERLTVSQGKCVELLYFGCFFQMTMMGLFACRLLQYVYDIFHVYLNDMSCVGVPWCAPVKAKHGHVRCQTPRGEHYKNVLGSRCKIHCERGYELHGSNEILCMANKQWSGKYTCRGQCRTDTIYRHIRWCLLTSTI